MLGTCGQLLWTAVVLLVGEHGNGRVDTADTNLTLNCCWQFAELLLGVLARSEQQQRLERGGRVSLAEAPELHTSV